MNRIILSALVIFLISSSALAQKDNTAKPPAPATGDTTAINTANATLAAHGGDKLKQLKSLVMKGSADLTFMGQAMPGAFSTAVSGDKYYFELTSAVQSLKQVCDGRETYSSIQGFALPPVTSLGFPVLQRIGDTGYKVSELGELLKKKNRGFRITTPEGYYTDFFVDEKTNQIKGYESSYEIGGRVVTTSVAVDEVQTVDGVVVPKKYSQRFDLGQITAYANFKTKEILVNSKLTDDAFAIPK